MNSPTVRDFRKQLFLTINHGGIVNDPRGWKQGNSPKHPQSSETTTITPGKATPHVMPGLVPRIVKSFRRKPGVIPTVRTVAKRLEIESDYAATGLLYELFEEVEELRRIVGRGGPVAVRKPASSAHSSSGQRNGIERRTA